MTVTGGFQEPQACRITKGEGKAYDATQVGSNKWVTPLLCLIWSSAVARCQGASQPQENHDCRPAKAKARPPASSCRTEPQLPPPSEPGGRRQAAPLQSSVQSSTTERARAEAPSQSPLLLLLLLLLP